MILPTETEAQPPIGLAVPPALQALYAPDAGMERQARVGTVRLSFLIAFFCAILASLAQAYRVDSREATLKKMTTSGQAQTMSDRQFEDETQNANRLYQVARVGQGVFEAPIALGLGSLGVLALVWFLRGKLKGRAVIPVAAAALLPGAIANILDALSAWNHAALPPEGAALAPRNVSAIAAALGHAIPPPWVKLGNVADLFSLWAAVLMGYGVAAAGEIPVRRAMITTLAAWLCLRLLTQVASGG